METIVCETCGGPCIPTECTTGYGSTPDGGRHCFPCCDRMQRDEFAAADSFFAYLNSAGTAVSTWTGGELARVTWRKRNRGGFGGEWWSVDATAPDGSRWYGRGGGPGFWLRLKRRKRRAA